MLRSVPLQSIDPNPFRHMDRYPINEDKIAELVGSMNRTGYWGNVVARKQGKCYQLAYGHHRWIAFGRKYGDHAAMTLIVRDLSDEQMLRIMADENMQEFGTNSLIDQETIRAVVLAYAEGKIGLPEVKNPERGGGLRNAPSFRQATFKEHKSSNGPLRLYNAESIARFLGWMSGDQVSPRVRNALTVLETAEALDAPEEFDAMTKGLGSSQAKEVVQVVKNVKAAHENSGSTPEEARKEALRAGMEIAAEVRKDTMSIRGVRDQGEQYLPKKEKKKEVPLVETFCRELSADIYDLLGATDPRWGKITEIIKFRDDIDEDSKNDVIVSLKRLSDRCLALIDALKGEPGQRLRQGRGAGSCSGGTGREAPAIPHKGDDAGGGPAADDLRLDLLPEGVEEWG